MSLEFFYDGVELDPDAVLMSGGSFPAGVVGLPAAAFNGEVATAGLQIEDPDGTLDLVGLHEFHVQETDCTGFERIFTGWLYGRRISRGTYRTGPGRVWDCDIVDQNFAFGLKVFRASSAKRPAETDIARMAFMVDSAPMAVNPVHAGAFANFTDNPVLFGESDYVTQYPVELAVSVAGTSGKNFYAYWSDANARRELYYDQVGAQLRNSTLRISNVIGDQDANTVYPWIDATLNRNPENVASGIYFAYRGGQLYRQRAQTITDFIDRDIVYRTDRVGRAETASALIDSMLIALSVEQDTITCTIRVPSSRVNHAHAGMWIDCKFTHLPGLGTGFTALPIIRRNVRTVPGRRDLYDIDLELTTRAPERGPGGGDPNEFPQQPCSPSTGDLIQKSSMLELTTEDPEVTLPATPTPGNILVAYMSFRNIGNGATFTGWTMIDGGGVDGYFYDADNQRGGLWWREVQAGDTNTITWTRVGTDVHRIQVAEFQGPLEYIATGTDDSDADQTPGAGGFFDLLCGQVTPAAGIPFVAVGGGVLGINPADPWNPFGSLAHNNVEIGQSAGGAPGAWWGYVQGTSSGASVTIEGLSAWVSGVAHGSGGAVALFQCSGDTDEPPPAGVVVRRETVGVGDGTTTVFTTRWPYADGSLRVFVDGVEIILGLTESDPAAGEFTLDFAPLGPIGDSPAEVITATYQGR